MNIALLQPTFCPNLYDMACILQSDNVILQDCEQWSRKGRVHRAKIRAPEGTQWINIPIKTEDRNKPINHVRIDQSRAWREPILKALKYNYRNSIYFDFYEPEITADFEKATTYTYLMPFSLFMRKRILRYLQITDSYTLSSDVSKYHSNPDVLAEQLGAEAIYLEHKSRHYMRQPIHYHQHPEFNHPTYRQHFPGFEPHCCLLDLLFQFGPESFKIMDQLHKPD